MGIAGLSIGILVSLVLLLIPLYVVLSRIKKEEVKQKGKGVEESDVNTHLTEVGYSVKQDPIIWSIAKGGIYRNSPERKSTSISISEGVVDFVYDDEGINLNQIEQSIAKMICKNHKEWVDKHNNHILNGNSGLDFL